MIKPLVSVIVPIYNVAAFVEKCVLSLISQDYENIEIILVDDGSTDASGTIIEKYRNIDSIKIIHKQNMGVSAARNDGLRNSNGEYIMFVDGDDYVESDYVSYFVSLLEETNCSIGIGTNNYVNNNKDNKECFARRTILENSYNVIEGIYLGKFGVAVWNKIYKKSIISDNNLFFNTNFWFAEGMLFNIIFLQYVDKVALGDKKVYHIVENQSSATRLFKIENYFCGLRSMEYQRDNWIKTSQNIKTAWEYHYRSYAESILKGLISTNQMIENSCLTKKCIAVLRKNIRIPLQANIDYSDKETAICLKIDPVIYLGKKHKFHEQKSLLNKFKLFKIKLFKRIPKAIKKRRFTYLYNKYNKNYKPVYLRSYYFEDRNSNMDYIQ